MSLQSWYCEECKTIGCVQYEGDGGMGEVFNLLATSHRTASPHCKCDTAHIRTINNDPYIKATGKKDIPCTADFIQKLLDQGYRMVEEVTTKDDARKSGDEFFNICMKIMSGGA